jgi:hypothetical protein
MQVSQSTVIFASILIAFIVYITVKGELPAYLALFTPSNSGGGSSTSSSSSAGSTASSATSILGDISTFADFLG